ncbi:hypothetical protein C8J57DRAFT_1224661 [Mycena rebaudengoi]|nr:hypothetical protein C8J57DRAFT_1224661 [Mycena rebaudengoi]
MWAISEFEAGELKLETPDAETLNAALGVITEINNISSSSKDDQDDQNLNSGTRAWRLVNTADDVEQVLSPFHSVEKNEVTQKSLHDGGSEGRDSASGRAAFGCCETTADNEEDTEQANEDNNHHGYHLTLLTFKPQVDPKFYFNCNLIASKEPSILRQASGWLQEAIQASV